MTDRPVFISSGDLIADRRYRHGMDFRERGDDAAAADLFQQAAEQAPAFAAAWYALGDARERLGDVQAAVAAFAQARAADPTDRQGAALRLARLGAGDPAAAMTPDYVRAVFDQYAPKFDRALTEGLGYRGPQLLLEAVRRACRTLGREPRFGLAFDLGCGTGLAAESFGPLVETLQGVDLSPKMVEVAERKGRYAALAVGEMLEFLRAQPDACAGLVLAADAFVYLADLGPVCREAWRVLEPFGMLAFTVETHPGEGVMLGETLRYAHGQAHVRAALAAAGLNPILLDAASTRNEAGRPVPGLVVVAVK